MFSLDLHDHDALAMWLQERFGLEGMAMLNADGPGLERIRDTFAPLIKSLSKKCRVITIAGTNGKGETAYRVERELLKRGFRAALWTSPHLVSVTERMRFNGHNITAQKLQQQFELLQESGRALSYYEFLFFSFLAQANELELDFLILEVGLGGRLDAVNLFDAEVCAVCSIGRDHQAILGNSLEKILYEKLGVTRAKKICISALESKFLRTRAKTWCKQHEVIWWDLFEHEQLQLSDAYPRRNQVLARALIATLETRDGLTALETLEMPENDQEFFPGRREVMTLGPRRFIFIGAHNLDGFRQAVRLWCQEGHPDEIWMSFSARPDKDLMACVHMLAQLPAKVRQVLMPFEHPRALPVASLKKLAASTEGRIEFESDWKQFLSKHDEQERTIAIVGSYYFIGAFMRELLLRGSSRS